MQYINDYNLLRMRFQKNITVGEIGKIVKNIPLKNIPTTDVFKIS